MNQKTIQRNVINSGISSFASMSIQVVTSMWVRTIINHQYRYGNSFYTTSKQLYSEGGVLRFYRGFLPAMTLGPLLRTSGIMSNTYVLNKFKDTNVPMSVQTLIGTGLATICRISLLPLSTYKNIVQVEGKNGFHILKQKIRSNGPHVLYNGSVAGIMVSSTAYYPWYFTFNIMDKYLPNYQDQLHKTIRNGSIGFCASVISDCVSNSFRILKIYKQTHQTHLSYLQIIKTIQKNDGYMGIFSRGLSTRIIVNGIQGILFTICWKSIEEMWKNNN